MDVDILDNLNLIGYTGSLREKDSLNKAIIGGAKNTDFTGLLHFLTNGIREMCNLDECVQATNSTDESAHFLLELSSFLKEINCPFQSLIQGHMSDRFSTEYDKLLLLDYLTKELLAARLAKINKPDQSIELKIHETSEANDLKHLLLALKFSKPPPNITPAVLFQKVEIKLQETVRKAGPDLCGQPLFNGLLSDKQWDKLLETQDSFHNDYQLRREMLLKRLDCTIQSFQWSETLKGKEEKITEIYDSKRKLLKTDVDVDLSDLLAARDDVPVIENQCVSGINVRKNTQTKLTKHIIGPVPDRGGRPSEQAPPPPEMPSWQQRSTGPVDGKGSGRAPGRGGFDLGRNSGDRTRGNLGGNYSQGNNYNQGGSNSYSSNSGYDNHGNSGNRGGNYDNRASNYDKRGNSYDNQGRNYDKLHSNFDNRCGNYNNRSSGYDSNYSSPSGNYSDQGRFSYNNYQVNKTSYAEQYVQECQQNQQYRGVNRDYNKGQQRGRSNYNRGGY